ncbi:MAG TPA: gliding motility-associated C-terminal domain-containing protein [Ferruginibacter sp.]|mgnify:CR=1 FL=1|nr:gliding motility-associated C-terminal domain-containing protein [Ferruginibacter sp.]
MIKKYSFILLLGFICCRALSQPCTTLGQTPATAFPVCGTDTFSQSTVPGCGGTRVFAPGCDDIPLADINPFWYRFTCFSPGTLGFKITPNDLADDYDWQIFDITGRNANDVYQNDPSIFVACNWSGETGITGASNAGTSNIVCASNGSAFRPLFSSMPTLIQGHEYILLVSHFTVSSQSGYALSFGGGTASITDPTEPALQGARAICDGIKMTVKLNKKMKCSSLNADGSDFTVTPAFAPIISAEGVNCDAGFDMDSIILTLASPVPPGNYTITVKNDVNGINLLDNCDRTIPLGQNLSVTVFPQIPTPMDSLTKIGCSPDELELVFSKPMLCNTVAADGSDFIVTGPSPVTVVSAAGFSCMDGLSSIIRVQLAGPIQTGGTYRITLQRGTDGNTVSNECSMETVAGSFINFTATDTVNADFNFNINLGCKVDVVNYSHPGGNGVNKWLWTFDNGINSTKKDTSVSYTVFGNKTATLIVSNGVCSDSTTNNSILLDNELKAVFENTAVVCPQDGAVFKERSYNRVVAWNWSFGEGLSSTLQSPPPQFYNVNNDNSIRDLPTRLIVTNDLGCSDTATGTIRVVGNCFIAVPKAFTPNGDGLNEFLYPTNAYKAKDLYFAIFNRNGNKMFETRNWQVKWDGTYKGNPQDPGTYVWILQYTHIDTGERYNLRGSTVLLR